MKLKMAERSLFAILLRSRWWISFVIAIVLSLIASVMLPRQYAILAPSAGFPFFVIGVIAAWKQLRAPSPSRVARAREVFADMSWRDFSAAVEQAYKQRGYTVSRCATDAADFEITGSDGKSLVACKRWKAAGTGIEPLKALNAAAQKAAARPVYMTLGTLTAQARAYAADNNIVLLQDAELVGFVPKS
ncbi:restriction endonuclease [Herbaspirillum sp. GCM10030257]|uniref:restriction endonuclease n=1 Tax=Herbaspirillum sp. GCM10030257 TaxID=3273393 RepID=UPI00360C212E